jgi:hypothetical protein
LVHTFTFPGDHCHLPTGGQQAFTQDLTSSDLNNNFFDNRTGVSGIRPSARCVKKLLLPIDNSRQRLDTEYKSGSVIFAPPLRLSLVRTPCVEAPNLPSQYPGQSKGNFQRVIFVAPPHGHTIPL